MVVDSLPGFTDYLAKEPYHWEETHVNVIALLMVNILVQHNPQTDQSGKRRCDIFLVLCQNDSEECLNNTFKMLKKSISVKDDPTFSLLHQELPQILVLCLL